MRLQEALQYALNRFPRDGAVTKEFTRSIFDALSLNSDAARELQIDAFTARLQRLLNDGAANHTALPARHAAVQVHEYSAPVVHVAVRILHDSCYSDAHGITKPVILFDSTDLAAFRARARAVSAGIGRLLGWIESVEARLRQCKKKRIADLAEGEQGIIARALLDVQRGFETHEFDRFRKELSA
jgi:hypothetical protein